MNERISGTIYAYNDGRQLHIYADNHGASPGTLSHCILPSEAAARDPTPNSSHDDNDRYGHGDPIPAGRPQKPGSTERTFPIGGTYGGSFWSPKGDWTDRRPFEVTIEPGAWFRVGFRNHAFYSFPIPNAGEILEIPYEEMTWYQASYYGDPVPVRADDRATGAHLPPVLQAMLANRSPQVIAGRARIVPVPDLHGELQGWELWFENDARGKPQEGQTHGFTGTAVLMNDQGEGAKNAGLGLESMGCPGGGYSALQFIPFRGDYGARRFGVRALPGARVRLGIRGHSTKDTTLPRLDEGERVLNLRTFDEAGDQKQSNWFDGELLMQKLGEKKGTVGFFRDGKRINDELADAIYVGVEAFERAEFKDPPRVRIAWVEHSVEHPGGGWEIRLQSLLPEEDDLGRVGFTAQLKLLDDEHAAGDAAAIPPGDFSPETREYVWFIPDRQQVGGIVAEPGQKLVIDTGALGWRAALSLPGDGAGAGIDTDELNPLDVWSLCESDFRRAGLYPRGEGPA